VVTGITGAWVVSTRLLNDFNFYLYGNLGKMVLFSVIVFGLLIRKSLVDLEKLPEMKGNLLYICVATLLVPVFFILGNNLLQYDSFTSNLLFSLVTHLVLVLIPVLLLIGIFGPRFLYAFIKRFWKELLLCVGISIVYDIVIFQVWKLWPIFSGGVLQAVRFLISLTASGVVVTAGNTIALNNFTVSIAEACSGLDSLFLFSTLYILIAVLDFKEFNKAKLILMFLPVALGLYIVNIIRVYFLIMIGAYVSADLGFNLFHTYIGMMLFIIYFYIFWKLSYSWMRK
jgi:exosortase/archaeosortase family protein